MRFYHTVRAGRFGRVALGATLAATLWTAGVAAVPTLAHADNFSDLLAAQQVVVERRGAYEEALGKAEELRAQAAENAQRVAEIEAALPQLRERAGDSMRVLYRMQQGTDSLIELILASENFNELITTLQYLHVIQSHNTDAVRELAARAAELKDTRDSIAAQLAEAEAEQARAEQALAEAQAAQEQVQQRIDAQAAAEEAERQAALERAREAEAAQQSFTTQNGESFTVPDVPVTPNPPTIDWASDRDSFINKWTPRIDAYLGGSPLGGYGRVFAEAAWDYGVDPRFSPAISTVESSQGRATFRPHNAWGWGNSSWGSWEEAIRAHVAGLASGYGGQLTYAGARKYCPPNADAWYAAVLAGMESI